MLLTIPELARAVGKSENYVRQHIFRKHLAVQKDGRNLSVTHDEAQRWASERQLPFKPPVSARQPLRTMENRTARMTLLALHRSEKATSNLLTVVRHRRHIAQGPWENEPSKTWVSEDLGNGLRLHSLDAPMTRCQTLIQSILDEKTLMIDGERIDYVLEPIPRLHRAFRDERIHADAPMTSPFSRHSAEIVEYWSLAEEPRRLWLDLLDSNNDHKPIPYPHLSVPLDRLSDRVGNIMVVGAQDEVTCDLWVGHDGYLRLLVDAEELLTGAYRATIWASHAGDEVLRREVSVVQRLTAIRLASDVDHIGFEMFRTADGQCLDRMDAPLVKRVGGQIKINSPSKLQFRNRQGRAFHEVNLPGPSTGFKIDFDENSSELDKKKRQLWLDRRVRQREAEARKERKFARFLPDAIDDAVRYLIEILRQDADQKTPIYLADPYFETHKLGEKRDHLNRKKIYLDIFSTTAGTPLRILCANQKQYDSPPWWSMCSEQVTNHIRVRSFLRGIRLEPGFHDRFLITPKREIMVSHSINGWHKDGVTFATLPYGVYRIEAERLWSFEIESVTADLFVREIGL